VLKIASDVLQIAGKFLVVCNEFEALGVQMIAVGLGALK